MEDYDDERDDPKYYKGRELQRRLAERVREADQDAKDRNKEQEGSTLFPFICVHIKNCWSIESKLKYLFACLCRFLNFRTRRIKK